MDPAIEYCQRVVSASSNELRMLDIVDTDSHPPADVGINADVWMPPFSPDYFKFNERDSKIGSATAAFEEVMKSSPTNVTFDVCGFF